MELIIAEKPSAAKKISEALGNFKVNKFRNVTYFVSKDNSTVILPAVGHLFNLKKNKRFYPVFDLIWIPNHEISKSSSFTKPYLDLFKSFKNKISKITIATDYDSEGEVIGYNILRNIYNKENANRMKFSSMTLDELKNSYKNKNNSINLPQVNAGLLRHYLDWYYGINLSQILSKSVSNKINRYQPMSVGRVQGPILAILAEREIEIENFKSKFFWQIFANLYLNKNSIKASHKKDKFFDEVNAKNIYNKVINQDAKVSKIDKIVKKIPPPFPFNLTNLQLESYKLFKYTPSMTLKLAQSLYSKGYISYPRTSSQKLPKSIGYEKIFNKLSKNIEYSNLIKQLNLINSSPNNGPKSDPAHPAIYPTGNLPKKISPYEIKIYDLIVKRFLSSFGKEMIRENTYVELDINSEKFQFSTSKTLEEGWSKLYTNYLRLKNTVLPDLNAGDIINQNSSIEKGETKHPPRYTPASLIKLLDREGIGTKATRSSIIEILENRKYISGNPIKVTKFGMNLFYTLKKFCPEIISVSLTKKLDNSMQQILEKKLDKNKILSIAENNVSEYYSKLKNNSEKIGDILANSFKETKSKLIELYLHNCGNMLIIRNSKKSKKRFIACSNYPECKFTLPLPQRGKISVENKKCNKCNNPMLSTTNKKKKWTFCPDPACKSENETT